MTQNTNGNVFLFFIPYLYVSYTNDTIYIYIYTIRKLQASLPNPSTNKMLRVSTFQAFKSLSFNCCLCNFETLNKQFHLSLRKLKAEGFQASGFSYSVSLPYLSQLLCCQQFDSSARVAAAMPVKRKSKVGRKTRSRIQRPPGKMEGLTSTRCSRNFLTSRRFASGDSAESIAVVLFCLRVIVSAM